MPGVGSTAFTSAGEVMDLVRSLLNDIDFPQAVANITPTGAVRASNIVTIQTAAAHGFTVGQRVTIAGVTDTTFNGTFTIASVPSASQFTFAQTAANASSGNGTATLLSVGDVFTDVVLLPLVNLGYRRTQRKLVDSSHQTFKTEISLALTAVTGLSFTDTSSPALPIDFLAPRELWERTDGTSNRYQPMSGPVSNLPDRQQSTALGEWQWREDGLYFVGATENREVLIRYWRSLGNLAQRDSLILVRGAGDLVALETAMLAASSKGASAPALWETLYQDASREVMNLQAKALQGRPARRIPYGGRHRSYRGLLW